MQATNEYTVLEYWQVPHGTVFLPHGTCYAVRDSGRTMGRGVQPGFVSRGQQLIGTRGVARILVRGGGTSDKISSKVARISVRSGDIQQKFTQQRLFKNFENLF